MPKPQRVSTLDKLLFMRRKIERGIARTTSATKIERLTAQFEELDARIERMGA